ncbi:MAG: hypothetical protein CL429_00820 [Acidimicrobiaceae bacterium]|nr:hypothetical protein [Acidimicrobiaceae bacterium]
MPQENSLNPEYDSSTEKNADTISEDGVETKVVKAPLDAMGKVVKELFQKSKEYRQEHELIWRDAYDAYRAKYPERINSSQDSVAARRGIYINQTRRKTNSAKVKIGSLLFDDGRIPFNITPSRKPRYLPQDLLQRGLQGYQLLDEINNRASAMEDRIRDILDQTGYLNTLIDAIHELCLYGTAVTKAPLLETLNYPVYETNNDIDTGIEQIESQIESELVPTVGFVSIWNVFPTPEATSLEDSEYVIQRSFLSSIQLRELSKTQEGYLPEIIDEVISKGIGQVSGQDESEHPRSEDETNSHRVKRFEVLEFWGKLDASDLKGHLPITEEDGVTLDVVIHVIGHKVIRMALNPFDGKLPYSMAYWQRNPEAIWGDGIYYSIRDVQALLNFSYAMMVEGKELSSVPLTVVNPAAFESGTDLESIRAGKQFKVRNGMSVQDAFSSIAIPDVTSGLLNLIQVLEREADLDSGQTAIGYGDTSPSQTSTATGMSILNSNANKTTASVVRSLSDMITKNVNALYRWLMVDSPDPSIKGDYEAISTGWTQYVAKEVHNTQLIQFLSTIGQLPQLQNYIRYDAFVQPLVRAFNLDPELIVKNEQEVQQMQQEQMQQQAQQAQQMEQMKIQSLQQELGLRTGFEKDKALLDEKKAASEDIRQSQIQERVELIRQGNVLKEATPDYYSMSMLINEEMQEKQAAQQQQEAEQQQAAQQQAMAAAQQGQEQMRQQQIAQLNTLAQQRGASARKTAQGGESSPGQIRKQARQEIEEQQSGLPIN